MDFREKTIFDFTDDQALLDIIAGNTPKDFYIKHVHPVSAINDIIHLAELTNNATLRKQAMEAAVEIEKKWMSVVDIGLKDSSIID